MSNCKKHRLLTIALGCIIVLMPAIECYGGGEVIKFGHYAQEDHFIGKTARKFADLCSRSTDRRVRITLHPNHRLGSIRNVLEQLQGGSLDMTLVPVTYLRSIVPQMEVLEMPFLFGGYDDADRILGADSDIASELLKELGRGGMKGLAFWEIGFRHISTDRRLVQRHYDMKGLRIRSAKNDPLDYAFELLGARPIYLPYGELYEALQSRYVEAQEGSLDAFFRYRFYETQRAVSMTRHAYSALVLVMSRHKYERLRRDHQHKIAEAAIEASNYGRQMARDLEQNLIRKLRDRNIQVEENPDREGFRKRVLFEVTDRFVRGDGLWLVKRIERALLKEGLPAPQIIIRE